MMDDGADEFCVDGFSSVGLKKKLDAVKRIVNDSDCEGNKQTTVRDLLQSCIEMMNLGKNALERIEKDSSTPSIIVNKLISYEKGVIVSFEHCSESSLIYGDFITSVKQSLTELFKKTSEIQTLFFRILERVQFDLTLKEDLDLLLSALQHIWYGAKAVYKASNKVMTTNWKAYITMSQKYSTEVKNRIIIDEPIDFLCTEIKNKVLSNQCNDEPSLKLTTYMMNVLLKLYSYGYILVSNNVLVEFILFLNSYWLSDKQDVVAVKERLQQLVDQLVLISDESFVKVFQLICQGTVNSNCANQKISALYTAMLLLKRIIKTQCDSQLTYEIIYIVFQLIKCTDLVMCWFSVDIYEPLLINLASVILMSDYNLFENVETILIQCILNTDYWPAMFSCDLWIIITRYLSSDLQNAQFTKLARLLEELSVFPCFTQCPQCIYLETLLRRHFALITDKKQLVNTCPQFKMQNLKSAVGILHVPTLSKYNRLSDLVKMITLLPEQNKYEHLNEEILYLWNCIQNEYPPNFICALVEVSICSNTLLKAIVPRTTEILDYCNIYDTTEVKRCRLRLIRSILLCTPKFQEKLVMENFLKYLFDHHPLVQQWTVETIVYFSSVAGNQNNLISMLFKHPEIRTVVTNYLEMKIDHDYNYNDFVQYFERLSIAGQFQHTCSIHGKLGKLLNKLEADIDCFNDIVRKTQISTDELKRLKKCSSLLNNICTDMQFEVKNI